MDDKFEKFLSEVLPGDVLEERDVCSALEEALVNVDVERKRAAAVAAETAREFRRFQQVMAEDELAFQTHTDVERALLNQAARRFVTSAKRAWLKTRYEAELRRLRKK